MFRKHTIFLCFIFVQLVSLPAAAQQSSDSSSLAFEDEIEAFERADRQQMPPEDAILFVGSSSIKKWTTLKQDFPQKEIINRGFGGSQFSDLLEYANRIVYPYKPRQIFVYEGDNDLYAGNSPQQVLEDFQTFVSQTKHKLPQTSIVFISIKPSIARNDLLDKMAKANKLIQTYIQNIEQVQYVDIFTKMLDKDGKVRSDMLSKDNLHMNAKGYEMWRNAIRPYLN